FEHTVAGEASYPVEDIASLQILLSDREDVADRLANRRSRSVMEKDSACNGGNDLNLREMERRVKGIEGAVAHLEKVHILGVDLILAVADYEYTGVRLSTDEEIDDAAAQKLIRREKAGSLLNVRALVSVHATLADTEARRVGKDGTLHGELGAVGEGGNHGR